MKFKHECIEYDGLEIDETWLEFSNCLCFEDEQAKIFKSIHDDYIFQLQRAYSLIESLKKDKKNSPSLGNG